MAWSEIAGYEGLYLISDKGEVIALPKSFEGANEHGKMIIHRKQKRLKTCLRGKEGQMYEAVTLTKDKVSKRYSIHRLVAEAFIPNPENYPEVNHKDENPLNNSVENLEWCTHQYNMEYSKNKRIRQLKDGIVVAVHESIKKASQKTGIGRTSINNNLCGWSKSAGGFQWEYVTKE